MRGTRPGPLPPRRVNVGSGDPGTARSFPSRKVIADSTRTCSRRHRCPAAHGEPLRRLQRAGSVRRRAELHQHRAHAPWRRDRAVVSEETREDLNVRHARSPGESPRPEGGPATWQAAGPVGPLEHDHLRPHASEVWGSGQPGRLGPRLAGPRGVKRPDQASSRSQGTDDGWRCTARTRHLSCGSPPGSAAGADPQGRVRRWPSRHGRGPGGRPPLRPSGSTADFSDLVTGTTGISPV